MRTSSNRRRRPRRKGRWREVDRLILRGSSGWLKRRKLRRMGVMSLWRWYHSPNAWVKSAFCIRIRLTLWSGWPYCMKMGLMAFWLMIWAWGRRSRPLPFWRMSMKPKKRGSCLILSWRRNPRSRIGLENSKNGHHFSKLSILFLPRSLETISSRSKCKKANLTSAWPHMTRWKFVTTPWRSIISTMPFSMRPTRWRMKNLKLASLHEDWKPKTGCC